VLLRELRRAAGLSRDALAERAGLSAKAVASLEQGERLTPRATTVRLLADALGVEPSVRADLLLAAARLPGTPRPKPKPPHNLPAPLASLVGRADELAIIGGRLQGADTRLLTVVGAGGSGKSRLALAAAWALRPHFADGAWWVELVGIGAGDDPSLECTTVASTVAAAMGIALDGRRAPLQELAAILGERSVLLVLDNCEHLPEVATIARTVLQAAPRLRLLATSRQPLGLSGETLLPLEGLPVPDEEAPDARSSPAVRLLLDRAARHTPGWGQDPEDVVAAGRLCRLLEGMPLGIELAAHWVGHYTPDEIAAALQRDLAFLVARNHDVPERQRSLRAVFATSWNLLTQGEQQALARLSVFRGSVDRAAAQAVAGVASATLVTLVDKSLLRHLEVGRYGLHELLRQFAAERLAELGEAQLVGERHLAHELALAQQAAAELRGPGQQEWLARLDRDLDNVRAALTWAREQGETGRGLRLTVTLHQFWVLRGYWSEARRWLEEGLERGQDVAPELRANAVWSLGALALEFGEHERATQLLGEAAARFVALGDRAGLTRTLTRQGIAASRQGKYDAATALLQEGLRLAEELGDQPERALALLNLGVVAAHKGNPAAARDWYEAALVLERPRGDPQVILWILQGLALLSVDAGNLEEADTLLHEVLALGRELASKSKVAYALANLGDVATQQGRYEQAAAYLRESVVLARELGDMYLLMATLAELAKLAAGRGQAERTVQLSGADARLRDERGIALHVGERARRQQALIRARAQLGEDGFQRAWAIGRAMDLDDAVRYALDGVTAATDSPMDHPSDTAAPSTAATR
jgi:predicted ATPase/transcriptional regulator with XRE-family HTH domain/Tfp pilus assembly protein PilF